MNYAFTMINPTLAISPVVADTAWEVVGIDGNQLYLARGNEERTVELPFYDGGGCEVEAYKIDAGDTIETVHMLIPHPRGQLVCEVTASWDKGQLFAVARVGRPTSQRSV